jgi:hypothetical protein
MSRVLHNTATIIKFRFLKPGPAFRIGQYSAEGKVIGKEFGNFYPKQGRHLINNPRVEGNTWVEGYDLEHVFSVELETEIVRGLPAHIAQHSDEVTRNAYKVDQAKVAGEAHAHNNYIRDELAYHEEQGTIKILSDSFLDEVKVVTEDTSYPSAKSVGRPKKVD